MKSIQQKLEQLVAVHRQLLRKYASLESEHNEARQKLGLRDDRIKHLEGTTRLMAGNMKAQSEKHLEELSALHGQLAELRQHMIGSINDQEGEDHTTNSKTTAALSPPHIYVQDRSNVVSKYAMSKRNHSVSSDGIIRPIRGGGRRSTMLGVNGGHDAQHHHVKRGSTIGDTVSNAQHAQGSGFGFLQRMLGLK